MRFYNAAILLLATTALAGCNAVDTSSVAGSTANGTTGTTTGGGGGTSSSKTAAGESCTSSDTNKLCLAVHFVAYKDSSGKEVATTAQAGTIIHTMNQLWSGCNIGFQIEKYEAVDPTTSGLTYGAQSQNELNQIRNTYTTTNDELLAVTTGPWGTAVNAWTAMPGGGPYGAVMEASIVDYGGGIIYAHEFGHYLGLDHVGDTSDLMNAIIYTTSTKIDSSQCATARATAVSYWSAMLRT